MRIWISLMGSRLLVFWLFRFRIGLYSKSKGRGGRFECFGGVYVLYSENRPVSSRLSFGFWEIDSDNREMISVGKRRQITAYNCGTLGSEKNLWWKSPRYGESNDGSFEIHFWCILQSKSCKKQKSKKVFLAKNAVFYVNQNQGIFIINHN